MTNLKNLSILIILLALISFSACNNNQSEGNNLTEAEKVLNNDTSLIIQTIEDEAVFLDTLTAPFKDIDLVDVTLFNNDFVIKIPYASSNNFVDTVLYPCEKCLLRYEVLRDLLKVQSEFKKMGYTVKLLDCYRPLSVQKIMWKKFPVPGLVADPATGSRHNRGSAVDITLIDKNGNELDMGTKHDDMITESKTFYKGFSDTIFKNRMLLRTVMQNNHFIGINSEWWHFSHDCGTKYKVSDVRFDCDSLK